MRIAVSAELCSGQGRCYVVSPTLFEADDEGFCAQRGTEFEVPSALEHEARTGVDSCPEGAIRVTDAATD
jgi:ferredoxin